MKHLFLLFLFTGTFYNSFAQKSIDRVVAQVGDNIILYSEVQGQLLNLKRGSQESLPQDIECTIVEDMMYQFLLVNQAELDSIVISDEQVDAEMENRLRVIEGQMKNAKDDKGNPITLEGFYGKTRAQIKEEFRVTIKKRMQGQEVERGITANTQVSPREVELFYKSIPTDSLPYINSQISYQQIAILPSITKADKEIAKKTCSDYRELVISKRKTMCDVARNSDDPGSASQCGRIEGTKNMMVKAFEEMAYSLKPGEISPVFETEYGFHFMEMVELKGNDFIVNHVLIAAKFSIDSLNAASIRLEKAHDALKKNSIIWENAVLKFSEDLNSKGNVGYITNPILGEIRWDIKDINEVDPQMFMATDALSVGQYTSPSLYYDYIERREGIRILRVAERINPHVANLQDDYNMFRQLAEEDKRAKAIANWTKSRISSAYVRIDDEYKSCAFQNQWITP
jgi:peptidyl-prolyl cis-trans isomerase SurA